MDIAKKVRNAFLIAFLISFIVFILSNTIYIIFNDSIIDLVSSWYGIPLEDAALVCVQALTAFKLADFLLFLVPGLAIHFAFVGCCCCKKNMEEK